MSGNTHTKDLVDSNAGTGSQHDWSTHAPPEMTYYSIDALRSAISEERMVMVEWYDPRTVTHAPWDMYCRPEDMKPSVALSVGFADDLPDERAILVRPHFVNNSFDDDDDWDEGEIVIPYTSIRFIHHLDAGDAKFSCYTSGRPSPSTSGDTETDTKDGTL